MSSFGPPPKKIDSKLAAQREELEKRRQAVLERKKQIDSGLSGVTNAAAAAASKKSAAATGNEAEAVAASTPRRSSRGVSAGQTDPSPGLPGVGRGTRSTQRAPSSLSVGGTPKPAARDVESSSSGTPSATSLSSSRGASLTSRLMAPTASSKAASRSSVPNCTCQGLLRAPWQPLKGPLTGEWNEQVISARSDQDAAAMTPPKSLSAPTHGSASSSPSDAAGPGVRPSHETMSP